MQITIHHINAFTDRPFSGNPAAVCQLEQWLPATTMQAIAAQNNLSETAFLVKAADGYELRWFTPAVEVDLCGHATLASAFVLFEMHPELTRIPFTTRSGVLRAQRQGDRITLDFPANPPHQVDQIDAVAAATGVRPQATLLAEDLIAVYPRQASIQKMEPNLPQVAGLPGRGLVITAPAEPSSQVGDVAVDNGVVDFVSRWFGPKVGVDEDPVTGSAHCALVPYWCDVLQKDALTARQLSARGGTLFCRLADNRVLLSGYAKRYLRGLIDV